jgi:uncharacterized membrane protein
MSARLVLWLHIGVVCCIAAIARLERTGAFNTINAEGYNDITAIGVLALGLAEILCLSILLFPVVIVVVLIFSKRDRLVSNIVAEALLVLAHVLAIAPLVSH